jgi:hypothetical protein
VGEQLVGVVVGWVLGLGSTELVDRWRQKRKVGRIKIAISKELREVALRLISIVYMFEGSQGRLNRELLTWMELQLGRYAGPNPGDELRTVISKALQGDDEVISRMNQLEKAHARPHVWSKEEAGYTVAASGRADEFEPDYAVRVLDILSHLRILNELRDDQVYYMHLTFASGISSENHARAVRNAALAEEGMARRARIVIGKITELEEAYPLKTKRRWLGIA